MTTKKIISLVTVIIFITSILLCNTVYGGTINMTAKITRDQAVAIAKPMLSEANLYETSNISLNPNSNTGGKLWSINFNKKQNPGGSVSVSIDADSGEIINYYSYEGYNGQQNFIAKFTKAEGQIKAETYLSKQLKENPDNFQLQKEVPNLYNKGAGVKQQIIYNYNYLKKVNGIPFTNDSINIGVDGVTGKITSFYKNSYNTSKLKFPSNKDILSKDTALLKYKEAANIILQYIISYEQQPNSLSKQKISLAYLSGSNINMIDAISGKIINPDGSAVAPETAELKQLREAPQPMIKDAKLESKPFRDEQTNDKAESRKSIVEEILGCKFEDNNNNMYSNYSSSDTKDNIWNFSWYKNKENGNANFNISINGSTGHVTSMYFGNYDYAAKEGKTPEVNEKFNWKESKKKALEIIKKVLPDQYGFYVDENIAEPELSADTKKTMREYNFVFTRIANGIRFRDNTMNVSIDRETGDVRNFNASWSDLEFPVKTDIIEKEKAAKKYFEGIDAQLTYYLKVTYDKTNAPVFAEAPQLNYTFTNTIYPLGYGNISVDAISGKLQDYSGNEIKQQTSAEELKLKENWAKRSVELLISQGILTNYKLDYSAGVTKYEAIRMFMLAKGFNYYDYSGYTVPTFTDVLKNDEFYTYIENAVNQKIITDTKSPYKGNEIITKAEFAKLLINLIGYSDVAKFKDIYKLSDVVNISDDMTGYIALAKALELLPLTPGDSFDGSKPVNLGEASSALYKALSFIK